MAIGDVVSGISNIAASATLEYQPSAGVEVVITAIASSDFVGTAPNGYPNMDATLYNGTIWSAVLSSNISRPLKVFINNSIYLRLTNFATAAKYLAYTGIQTK